MKKSLCILLAALMAIGLAACGAPTATSIPSFVVTEAPAVVEFADPVLEDRVRGAIGQPEGGIQVYSPEGKYLKHLAGTPGSLHGFVHRNDAVKRFRR